MQRIATRALIVLVLAGCGAEQETSPSAVQGAELPPGIPAVELSAGRVTLRAAGVPRAEILEQLAREAGFRLEQADPDRRPLDLRLEGASLEVALGRILEGVSYGLDYVQAAEGRGHVLALVRVGVRAGEVAPTTQMPAPAARTSQRPRGAETGASDVSASERWVEPIDDEVRESLESADPETRLEGILALDAEGEGFRILVDALENDPEPEVRAAAADELGYAGSFAAIQALLVALDDSDPLVVVQVVEALESTGDETLVPHLEPYLEHRDPEVRQAVQDALEYLD